MLDEDSITVRNYDFLMVQRVKQLLKMRS